MAHPAASFKTAKDAFIRIYCSTRDLMTAHVQLHFTLRTLDRVDNTNTFARGIITSLEKNVRALITARILVKQFYNSMSKGLDDRKWKEFSGFWDQLASYMNDQINIVVRSVTELMRKEIEHIWHFTGMILLSSMYPPPNKMLAEGSVQHAKMVVLWHYSIFAQQITTTCYLFLDVKPHLLDPMIFFIIADAIYYFAYRFYESVVRIGATVDNLVLYHMAYDFIQLGTMCPILKLEFSSPEQAIVAAQKKSAVPLSPTAINKIMLLSRVKIATELFHATSILIGDKLARHEVIKCLRDSYVLQIVEAVLKDAIRKVKSVYIEMRRIVCYTFLQVFPRAELQQQIHKLLKNNMRIYFHDCIEMLRLCKQTINSVRTMTTENADMAYETMRLFKHVYVPYKSMCNALPDIIKDGVIEFVRLHYIATRDALMKETALYIIAFVQKSVEKGSNPVLYKQVMLPYLRAIMTFKNMSNELETAINECGDGMFIALEGTTRDTVMTILECLRIAYAKLPQVQGHYVNDKIILQQLPLNEQLRKAIVAQVGPQFDGSESDIDPRYFLNKTNFPRKDIDLKFFVPPQHDVLTKNELDVYFAS